MGEQPVVDNEFSLGWFKLAKYEQCTKELNFNDWAMQIWVRLVLEKMLVNHDHLTFDDCFEVIKAKPLATNSRSGSQDFAYSFSLRTPVFPMTVAIARDIFDVLNDSDPDSEDYSARGLLSCDSVLRGEFRFRDQAMMVVNLGMPKALILESFEKWLGNAISEHHSSFPRNRLNKITQDTLNAWNMSPLLAYKDLELYHRRHNIKLPVGKQLRQMIYPNRLSTDRECLRQIREKSEAVFTHACRNELLANMNFEA